MAVAYSATDDMKQQVYFILTSNIYSARTDWRCINWKCIMSTPAMIGVSTICNQSDCLYMQLDLCCCCPLDLQLIWLLVKTCYH